MEFYILETGSRERVAGNFSIIPTPEEGCITGAVTIVLAIVQHIPADVTATVEPTASVMGFVYVMGYVCVTE